MLIIIAGVVGLVVGEVMRRWLNRLSYRLPADVDLACAEADPAGAAETDLPAPGQRWWVPVVLAVAWGCTFWALPDVPTPAQWLRTLGWLAFATIGLWLAVIDLDVRRLPDIGQIWLAAATIVCGVAANWQHPPRLLVGLAAALICGLAFLIINIISRGNLGLGDVKLVMTCGWWLGLASWTTVYAGLMIGCLLGLAYAALTRSRHFAFGPWLVVGTLVAGLVWT